MRRPRRILALWLLALADLIEILAEVVIGTLEELAGAMKPSTRKRARQLKVLPLTPRAAEELT